MHIPMIRSLGSPLKPALAALLVATLGCGGGSSSSSTPTTSVPITPSLTIINLPAPSGNVAVGSTVQLTASPIDQSGNAFSTTLAWSSSNTAAATVVPASGLVTGVSNGTSVITAASGSVQNSVTVGVGTGGGTSPLNATVVATESRTFSPGTATIQAGGTVQFVFPGIQHTVTFSATSSAVSIPGSSGTIVARTFNSAGTFEYQCTIHSGMTGTIVVR